MPHDPVTIFGLSEPVFRIGAFLCAFLLFSGLEAWRPKRKRQQDRTQRWLTNGGMLALATLLVSALAWLAPLMAMTASATLAGELGWGLLNQVALPSWAEILIAIVLLDLAVWFQHLVSHKIPFLWRLHRVHHTDRDLDASSALRFHPVEIALSALYKLVIVLLLGPAILATLLFGTILNASAIFNHANLAMPRWLDRILRTVLVTPDMHRVHHSVHRFEHDTNFGFCLSIWDRMFHTYTPEPEGGHSGMTIGLKAYQTDDTQRFSWSLWLPLK